jgi:hypothetical protein
VLTDQVDRGQDGEGRARAALAAHRVFPLDAPLYCEFEVFGAARAAADGAPHVLAGITVTTADGEVVRHAEPTRIVPAADGRLVRLAGLDLGDLEAGDYELSLVVEDEAGGGSVARKERFTLASTTGM